MSQYKHTLPVALLLLFCVRCTPVRSPENGVQPILVITDSGGSEVFHTYIAEILAAEGILCFEAVNLHQRPLTFEDLTGRDIVILPRTGDVSPELADALTSYVGKGGALIGLRPDTRLASLFGLAPQDTTLSERYVLVDTTTAIGNGVTGQSMQFHGEADVYACDGASVVAWLCTDAVTATGYPAVAVHDFGSGRAVSFTYDLAASTVLFRQGQYKYRSHGDIRDPDGDQISRQNDLLFRYLDDAKADIPQADEQQDVLVNAIMYCASFGKPLPRLWYFPGQAMAVAWFTGDGDDAEQDQIRRYADKTREYGGYFTLFEGAGNDFDDELDNWLLSAGHSTGKHVNLGCRMPPLRGAESEISRQIQAFIAEYGHQPLTDREHCLNWVGWTEHAGYLHENGVRINSNATSFKGNDGHRAYLNASGLPMKYIDERGAMVDLYQQSTTFYEKHDPAIVEASVADYHTVLTYSFHPVYADTRLELLESAVSCIRSQGIPMVSGDAWAEFLDARRALRFDAIKADESGHAITFAVIQGERPIENATLMIPVQWGARSVASIREYSAPVVFTAKVIDGVHYALWTVSLDAGQMKSYTVLYE